MKSATSKKSGFLFSTLFWVVLNMMIFCVLIGIASALAQQYFDGADTILFADPINIVTVFFTLLAASVGLASMIMAAVHGGSWNEESRYSSLGSNLVAFALIMLAFGFACKAIDRGFSGPSNRVKQFKTIAALDIIAGFTMLMYLLNLGLFKHREPARKLNDTQDTTTTQPHREARGAAPGAAPVTGVERGPTEGAVAGPKFAGGHELAPEERAPAV
ncbi:hypothetical protein JKP88DRAFT_280025 [Tribonema minus]|uniref:Uncharacterized protein n=1 Tax=Tribonema minus TaxID=303371 RepID=A0A835YTU5_9STRA|nr:hypothetical protein JKP88DRAFT_280025 [Tribonema minus]